MCPSQSELSLSPLPSGGLAGCRRVVLDELARRQGTRLSEEVAPDQLRRDEHPHILPTHRRKRHAFGPDEELAPCPTSARDAGGAAVVLHARRLDLQRRGDPAEAATSHLCRRETFVPGSVGSDPARVARQRVREK